MKKFGLTIMSFCLAFSVYSQRCGGAIFSKHFYVPIGQKMETIQYEMFPLTESLDSGFLNNKLSKQQKDSLWGRIHNGIVVSSKFVNVESYVSKLKKIGKPEEAFENGATVNRLKSYAKRAGLGEIKLEGIVEEGVIKFPTIETLYKYFILKFVSGKNSGYVIGNFFGGCRQKVNVVLE